MLHSLLVAIAISATPACGIAAYTRVPLNIVESLPTAAGTVNQQPVRLIIDTGSGIGRVPSELLPRLSSIPFRRSDLNGEGDHETYLADVTVRGFKLGRVEFGTIPSLPIKSWNKDTVVLGMDSLSKVGVVIDLKRGELAFVRERNCTVFPKNNADSRVARKADWSNVHINANVAGNEVDAILDTGSSKTVISGEVAAALGISVPTKNGIRVSGGVSGLVFESKLPTLTLAARKFEQHPVVVSEQLNGRQSMIIGTDILSKFVIYISSKSASTMVLQAN